MFFSLVLFIISFLLVISSSYLITSMLSKKNDPCGLFYFPITIFSQVVLTFEILSLFKAISIAGVLFFNILIASITYHIWNKKNKPLWFFEKNIIKRLFKKIINSFKLDKTLIVLGICYAVFIFSALFLAIIMPVTSGDGKVYHVARSFFYVIQGSLNHFTINDIRALCMPINSEILYSWIILFFKKDVLLALYSFFGYVYTIIALFNIMGFLKFSYRRRLWIIFILSSFSSVIVQASSTETDIIITALVSSSIYLFWSGLKNNTKIPVVIASLSYALAIGTKTPSIIMIPAVGFFMLTLCFYYKKYRPLGLFLGCGVLNFIIFSSYNYILNLIHFGNITGPETFMIVSKNYDGIKGACANFIKYIFMFFDFTGFKWPDYIMDDLLKIKDSTLAFFGLANMKDGLYTVDKYFQRSLIEQLMGAGILGFAAFLPCWIFSLTSCGFSKNRTRKLLFLYAVVMLINLISISYLLSYMSYSVRFLMSFMVLSAPILAFTYFSNKNPLKYIIIYFSIYYLAFVSTHIWVRPFVRIVKYLKTNPSIQMVRQIGVCGDFYTLETNKVDCKIRRNIEEYSKDVKILLLPESAINYVGYGKLILKGYKIDIGEPEMLSFMDKDFNEYDLIISPEARQRSTIIKDYENRKNDFVVDSINRVAKRLIERPYDCIYEYNERISVFDEKGELRKPLAVVCNITPKYLKTKNFRVSRIVGIEGPDDSLISNFYFFYQNISKKPKLKK